MIIAAAATATTLLGSHPALARTDNQTKVLYRLNTDCTINNEPSRCKVEAIDGKDSTVYRTITDQEIISFRLIDSSQLRGAQIWDNTKKDWVALDRLSLNFTNNQICINGTVLCTTNPNYFASLGEDYPNLRTDLIVSRFSAKDGRLAAICYSQEACDAGF